MTRRAGVVSLVVALIAAVAVSPQPASGQSQMSSPVVRDPAIQLLRKRVDKIDWIDTPFEEVISWLRAESDEKVNVIPRWTALGVEGVDADSLVNLRLSGTTVADVLNEAVLQLSEDGEVRYRASGNKLTFSTRADFGRKLELRIYDAADILFRVPNFGREAPLIDLSQQVSTGGGGGGGGGSGRTVFGTGGGGGGSQQQGGEREEQELEQRLEELGDIIEAMIEPQSWASGGSGGRGQISVFNNSLLVLNTIEVHEQIAGWFSHGQ